MRGYHTRPKRSLPRRSGPIGIQRRIWGGEVSRRGPERCKHRFRPAPTRTPSTARPLSRRPGAQDRCASDRYWPAGARIAGASPNDDPAHRSRPRCASRRAGGRAFLSPFKRSATTQTDTQPNSCAPRKASATRGISTAYPRNQPLRLLPRHAANCTGSESREEKELRITSDGSLEFCPDPLE